MNITNRNEMKHFIYYYFKCIVVNVQVLYHLSGAAAAPSVSLLLPTALTVTVNVFHFICPINQISCQHVMLN